MESIVMIKLSDSEKGKIICIGELLAGIAVFICVSAVLNKVYVTPDPWNHILFQSYNEQDRIDYLFMGTSHTMCAVDPTILDEINGGNNFNFSTEAQRWDDTYFLLNQACADYNPKHVFLECYYVPLCTSNGTDYIDQPGNYSRAWSISYYMKPTLNNLRILLTAADKDHIIETLLPFVRYRENLFNTEVLVKNHAIKGSEEYRNHKWHIDLENADGSPWVSEYLPKGYRRVTGVFMDAEKKWDTYYCLPEEGFGSKSEEYLRKTIEYCQDQNIPVTLFTCPINSLQLISIGGYDDYVSRMREIAAEYNIAYYDFNLIKPQILDMNNGMLFRDSGHLNADGAEEFTPILWEVLSDSAEGNSEKFFSSYAERLNNEAPMIYGVFRSDNDRHYTVATNRVDMLIEVSKMTNMVTEDDLGKEFELPSDEHGTLIIKGCLDDWHQSMEVLY